MAQKGPYCQLVLLLLLLSSSPVFPVSSMLEQKFKIGHDCFLPYIFPPMLTIFLRLDIRLKYAVGKASLSKHLTKFPGT
jgi:hypothetical protein